MDILEEVTGSWVWTGINPTEILDNNSFGNLIIKDVEGKIWRMCPEDVYCKVISNSLEEYNNLLMQQEFLDDWHMTEIVDSAIRRLGNLTEDRKYYLVIPGILGGEYYGENVQSISYKELIRISGYYGRQLKDLKPGDKVDLEVINAPS